MAGSTAGIQGPSASGMRQEMRRNCTDRPVSGVPTGIRLKDVHAGQDLFKPIPAQGGYGPDCLVNRELGVRVPPFLSQPQAREQGRGERGSWLAGLAGAD